MAVQSGVATSSLCPIIDSRLPETGVFTAYPPECSESPVPKAPQPRCMIRTGPISALSATTLAAVERVSGCNSCGKYASETAREASSQSRGLETPGAGMTPLKSLRRRLPSRLAERDPDTGAPSGVMSRCGNGRDILAEKVHGRPLWVLCP